MLRPGVREGSIKSDNVGSKSKGKLLIDILSNHFNLVFFYFIDVQISGSQWGADAFSSLFILDVAT